MLKSVQKGFLGLSRCICEVGVRGVVFLLKGGLGVRITGLWVGPQGLAKQLYATFRATCIHTSAWMVVLCLNYVGNITTQVMVEPCTSM